MTAIREIVVKNFFTPSGISSVDLAVNPYVGCPHGCLYCYAQFVGQARYGTRVWGSFLDVKVPINPLDFRHCKGKEVLIGSATDPYNPHEAHFCATRRLLEGFVQTPVYQSLMVLTKSDLVTRDIDLLTRLPHLTVGISLSTLEEPFRKRMEPGAASVARRIDALRILHDNQIRTVLFIAPLFPAITDWESLLETTRGAVSEYWFDPLNLRGPYRDRVCAEITAFRPDLAKLYREIYTEKNTLYLQALADEIDAYCQKNKISYRPMRVSAP